jgi:hypothetical protein
MNAGLLVLVVVAIVAVAKAVNRWTVGHGPGCTCRGCLERAIANEKARTYESYDWAGDAR